LILKHHYNQLYSELSEETEHVNRMNAGKMKRNIMLSSKRTKTNWTSNEDIEWK